jgi:glycosyltransferase involved in cell wall biosynthesis
MSTTASTEAPPHARSDDRPPRVLQALAGAAAGGAEKFIVRLILALDRAGVAQRVLIRPHANWVAALRAGGLDPVPAPFGRRLDLRTRPAFRREIDRFRPDIVLTHMSRASALCPRGRFVHIARLGGYYDLKYYRSCHHLVGNTADIRAYFLRCGWPPQRAHYIPNFVDEGPPACPCPRARLATPDSPPLLLALGRLHVHKAFDILLAALARLPGVWLWLAGAGPLDSELKRLAADLGVADRVRFLGWVDDVRPLLAAATVCVMPSRFEPLGNVVLEAWTQGVPMVAAASQGPGALIADGDSGLLVPIDDAPALASAIGRVLADPALAARLVAGGRRAYAASFTESAVVGRYLALFRDVLAAS